MKKILPIGKRNFTGKKFKSAKANELNASDKNVIKNNIGKYTNQQLAIRIGKPVEAVEKYIKKEKLTPINIIQEVENSIIVVEKTGATVKTPPTQKEVIDPPKIGKEKVRKTSNKSLEKSNFIKENYRQYDVAELAKRLNCSKITVRYHLKKLNHTPLGLKKSRVRNAVITERETFIKDNHQKYSVAELAEKLNCDIHGVRYYLRKLKLKARQINKSNYETPETISFLKANYRTMTARDMSDALGNVSWRNVKYLCEKHRFIKTPEEVKAVKLKWNISTYTAEEEKYMLENHGVITFAEIAANIKRTRSSVVSFMAKKGIKLTKRQHGKLLKRNFEIARTKAKEKV